MRTRPRSRQAAAAAASGSGDGAWEARTGPRQKQTSGERQEWRGGKGHDMHMGMTYNIVEKQECGNSVSHVNKWALRMVNR